MLHQDDLKWIAKTSAELNTVLQQIARYADLARRHKGDHDYIEQLNQQVEIASQSAQALFNRVSSKILEDHLNSCVITAIQGNDRQERERVLKEITEVFEMSTKV